MGFEGLRKIQSIDEIREGIESGEIVRGGKQPEKIIIDAKVTGDFDREKQTFSFVLNGIQTKASIRNGLVIGVELFDPDTDNARYDSDIKIGRTKYVQNLLDTGKIPS